MRRLGLVLSLLAALYVAGYAELRGPVRGPADPPQTLLVAPGSSGAEVARQIHALGLVRHQMVFRVLVALRGASGRLRAGEYELAGPLSLDQIVDMLVKGEDSQLMNKLALAVGGKPEAEAPAPKPAGKSHIHQARNHQQPKILPTTGPMAEMLKKMFGNKGE